MNTMEIQVISRLESPRRENIKKDLNLKNINFVFFDAVDKTTLVREEKIFKSKDFKLELNTTVNSPDSFSKRKWLKIGEVGCFFSHSILWKNLLISDKDAYCILEDDAVPQFTGNDIERFLKEESFDNIDMILCQSVSPNFPNGKRLFKNLTDKMTIKMSNAFDWETTEGTTGYIITKSGAKKILEVLDKYQFFNPVDNFIGRCVGTILTTYICPNYLQVSINPNVQTEIHYDTEDQKIEYIDEIKFITG